MYTRLDPKPSHSLTLSLKHHQLVFMIASTPSHVSCFQLPKRGLGGSSSSSWFRVIELPLGMPPARMKALLEEGSATHQCHKTTSRNVLSSYESPVRYVCLQKKGHTKLSQEMLPASMIAVSDMCASYSLCVVLWSLKSLLYGEIRLNALVCASFLCIYLRGVPSFCGCSSCL